MTEKEYIEWGRQYWKNRPQETEPGLPDIAVHELHAALGMVTEAGELADLFKKYLMGRDYPDRANVVDELGDLFYYIARMCDAYRISFNEIMEKNRVKLDYRMKFGKNKVKEAELQRTVENNGTC